MAIILETGRPALPIREGAYPDPPEDWSDLETYRTNLEYAIRAVGVLELEGHPYIRRLGTAFTVGPGRILTVRNMAETFAQGIGDVGLGFKPGYSASFSIQKKYGFSDNKRFKISAIRFLHPHHNVALCDIEVNDWDLADPGIGHVLTLIADQPEDLADRKLGVISLAEPDPRNAPKAMNDIYGQVFGAVYLQPGRSLGVSENKDRQVLNHDCSTSNGSGGGPVIDLETGYVLGVHYGGEFGIRNVAVPSWELARDPRVRIHGINFSDNPRWMYRWVQEERHWLGADSSAAIPRREELELPTDQVTKVKHFKQKDLYKIRDLLFAVGFDNPDKQPSLFVAMNATYSGSLPAKGSPDIRILTALDTMNRTGRLTDGELPLETFLLNAVHNAKPHPESKQLDGFLQELRTRMPPAEAI